MKRKPHSAHGPFVLPALALIVALFATTALAMGGRTEADGVNQANSGCVVGGCNGELCLDAAGEGMASTCSVEPEHACYKLHGTCKRTDGVCGWVNTPALAACLKNPPGAM